MGPEPLAVGRRAPTGRQVLEEQVGLDVPAGLTDADLEAGDVATSREPGD